MSNSSTKIKKIFKYDQKDYQDYDKTPIILGPSVLAVIEIYSKKSSLDSRKAFQLDMMDTNEGLWKSYADQYEEEAEKLIKSLEGNVCDAFMIALMREIFRYLKEGDLNCGTNRFGEEVERLVEEVKSEYLENLGEEETKES